MFFLNKILGSMWLVALFGVANMAPCFFSRVSLANTPVDFGRSWRGKRVFGDNKTWRGLVLAPLGGSLFFIFQRYLYLKSGFIQEISLFNYGTSPIVYGTLVSAGAILGDLVKSFFKRRRNIPAGKIWVPFDQIDYLIGGIVFGLSFYLPDLWEIILIITIGFASHLLFKYLGYLLKFSNTMI